MGYSLPLSDSRIVFYWYSKMIHIQKQLDKNFLSKNVREYFHANLITDRLIGGSAYTRVKQLYGILTIQQTIKQRMSYLKNL